MTIPSVSKDKSLIGQAWATCSPLKEVRGNREGHGDDHGEVISTRNTWTKSGGDMVTERKLRIHLSEKLCILDSGQEIIRIGQHLPQMVDAPIQELVLGFLFYSIDLYFCLCASTILS